LVDIQIARDKLYEAIDCLWWPPEADFEPGSSGATLRQAIFDVIARLKELRKLDEPEPEEKWNGWAE